MIRIFGRPAKIIHEFQLFYHAMLHEKSVKCSQHCGSIKYWIKIVLPRERHPTNSIASSVCGGEGASRVPHSGHRGHRLRGCGSAVHLGWCLGCPGVQCHTGKSLSCVVYLQVYNHALSSMILP